MNTGALFAVGLSAACLLGSACVLVEDFNGYRPLRPDEAQCDKPPCPTTGSSSGGSSSSSSGSVGVGGGNGAGGAPCLDSSCSGAGGAGGAGSGCAVIDCGSPVSPCKPVTVMTGLTSFLQTTDPSAYVLADLGASAHIQRVAKKGCAIQPVDVTAPYPQHVVSDGTTMAWVTLDLASPCATVALQACSTAACVPTNIPVFAMWPEQGALSALTFGVDDLFFMFSNGLVGRAPKSTLQPSSLWVDSAFDAQNKSVAVLFGLHYHAGSLSVSRQQMYSGVMTPCGGGVTVLNSAIFSLGTDPAKQEVVVATGVGAPTSVAGSDKYVYFFSGDNVTLLFRASKTGGAVESLSSFGEMMATLKSAPSIQVHNGFVYFEVNFTNGDRGVARLAADSPVFNAAFAEVVVRAASVENFTVDDDGMYWMECENVQVCSTRRLMAMAHGP